MFNSNEKFLFIHPTKTGGTAIEDFFERYYGHRILGKGHGITCACAANPIIVFRDPYERILSIYYYFKYGAEDLPKHRPKSDRGNITIQQFLESILNSKINKYFDHYFIIDHIRPQAFWYDDRLCKNIVLKYSKDLNAQAQKLLKHIGEPESKNKIPLKNITKNKRAINLSDDQKTIIKELYKADFILQDYINNKPEKFRLVID